MARVGLDQGVRSDPTSPLGVPSYNHDKFLAYDAFLCGWSLAHRRYQTQATRPAIVFVCPDAHAALACAREADAALTGRIGVMGTPPGHWYFPGRDHLFFAVEADVRRRWRSTAARPPAAAARTARAAHRGERDLQVTRVALLPDAVARAARHGTHMR